MRASFAQFGSLLQASVFGCVLALTACATLPPPTSELNAAQQSVARAVDADADQYAGDELTRAQTLLSQAQAAMAAGKQEDARGLANRAAAAADLANARSRDAAANTELAQRRNEINELRRRLQGDVSP